MQSYVGRDLFGMRSTISAHPFRLSSRDQFRGEGEKAGDLWDITGTMPWFCEIPQDQWEIDHAAVLADFQEGFGDKRQEVVCPAKSLSLICRYLLESIWTKKEFYIS